MSGALFYSCPTTVSPAQHKRRACLRECEAVSLHTETPAAACEGGARKQTAEDAKGKRGSMRTSSASTNVPQCCFDVRPCSLGGFCWYGLKASLVVFVQPYLHESRHNHARRRVRGAGGRFLNAEEARRVLEERKALEEAKDAIRDGARDNNAIG